VRAKPSRLAIVAAATLLFAFILPLGFAQVGPPTAKIFSIDYPKRVEPSKTFSVTVTSDYSIVSGVDVGIWDLKAGVVVQSVSIALPSPGTRSFSFEITAPSVDGDWYLAAITRIFWQNAWYQDQQQGSENFTVNISNTAAVFLTSEASGSTISVDGSPFHFDQANSTVLRLAYARSDAVDRTGTFKAHGIRGMERRHQL
jgi:hypothetical protein